MFISKKARNLIEKNDGLKQYSDDNIITNTNDTQKKKNNKIENQ